VNGTFAARHRTALFAAGIALGVIWPMSARAYRPFDSTDAAVAAKGEMEIEFGPLGFLKEGSDTFLVVPSVILNWGFADRWELVLEGRNFVQLGENITGSRFRLEDTALSLKGILREGSLQEKTGVSIASETGLLLPAIDGDSGVGAQEAIIVSQRWPDLTVHLNGAVAWTRAHRLGLFGGAIFEVHDTWPVRPVAEIFVQGERDVPTTVSGLVGAIWRLREGLSLDAGFRLARAGGVNTTEIRAGVTWAFSVGVPRTDPGT
jgi:hypothetical protein